MNYIIAGIGVWTIAKYSQMMMANYMLNHPFMTTRFQANLNQLKTN